MTATESPELKTPVRAAFFAVNAHLFTHAAVIVAGKRRDVYAIDQPQTLAPADVRVFHLVKCSKPYPEFGPYRVVVSTRRDVPCDCSCQGFGRWGACKHLVAMLDFCGVVQKEEPHERKER